jgi:hypothetical protein
MIRLLLLVWIKWQRKGNAVIFIHAAFQSSTICRLGRHGALPFLSLPVEGYQGTGLLA